MGRAGPRPSPSNFWLLGRGPSSENFKIDEPGRPRPIISKFDGPGRAAAHEMWAPYGPLNTAHEAAYAF